MKKTEKDAVRQNVKDFSDAFSHHAKSSNRLYLALIVSSSVIIFPHLDSSRRIASLPFSLGDVEIEWFYIIGIFIINIITLGYCQSYIMQYQIARDNFSENIDPIDDVRFRDEMTKLSDCMRSSTFTRVYPFVKLLSDSGMQCKPILQVYYLFLKFISITIIIGIPSFVIFVVARHIYISNLFKYGLYFIIIILIPSIVSLMQVLICELKYMRRVLVLKF